jgi:hypothetical protein
VKRTWFEFVRQIMSSLHVNMTIETPDLTFRIILKVDDISPSISSLKLSL